ncbi:MAG: hypothetical protein U0790_21605 [Isosphaeraceae bacterium]
MKGLFVAPEYYFARAKMGQWSGSSQKFKTRSIDQDKKDHIVKELREISKRFPGIAIIPGSIAWEKPLDRPANEFRKNRFTGELTTTLKTTDRRAKAIQHVKAVGDLGMGNQTKGNTKAEETIWDVINTNYLELGNWYYRMINNHAIPPGMAFLHVMNYCLGPGNPALRDDMISYYGLPNSAVQVIPDTSLKEAQLGKATHMMRNTAYLLFNGETRFKYNKKGDFHEAIGTDGKTVFIPGEKLGLSPSIGGLIFGMEICLDHALATLNTGFPSGSQDPDIHVVISDDVVNEKTNMRARKYFVHASTSSSQTKVYDLSGMKKTRVHSEEHKDRVSHGTIKYYKLMV